MLWSEDDISWLKGSDTGDYEQLQKRLLQADYELIIETVPGFEADVSFHQFQELFKTTATRAYNGQEGGATLVPFADKGNHNHKADAIWAFLTKEESSGFYVHATRDIAAGE